MGARRAVIIIDGSYSGENNGKGITTEDAKTKSGEVDGITETDFLPRETTVVLEASNPNETVRDGVFTHLFSPRYTAEQDSNGDGFITVHEFFTYAKNRMSGQATPHIGYGEADARRIPLVQPLLEITSNPPEATIKIDGQNRGTIQSVIVLDSGSHSLEAQKRGYKIWSRRVEGKPGRQKIDDCRLTPVEVSGTAVYGKTRKPLANAIVEFLGTQHPAKTTDKNGRFSFSEWEQYGISRAGSYQIRISDTQGRIKDKIKSIDIPEDFYDDISVNEIHLTEVVKISLEVYTLQPDKKNITDAIVIINQQQVIDANQDGTYEIEIENPDFSMSFTASREGYETYEGTIRIPEDIGKPYPVSLQPAIHTFSVEVKSGNNPVPGIAVILNDTQLAGTTDSQGKIEDKKLLVPDESLKIKLKKDDSVRKLSKSEWTIEKTGKNEYKISITPQTTSVRVIDLSGEPISGVQIKGSLISTKTDDNGRADILLFGENLEIFKSQLEFEKYDISYRPVNLEHQGGNVYSATLHIEYSNVIVQIYTEINKERINLSLEPKIYIEDGETKVTKILPGNHKLKVVVENDIVYEDLISVSPGENKAGIEIDLYRAWRLCLSLSQKTGKKEILESAQKVAEALGRSDIAAIFQKRMGR